MLPNIFGAPGLRADGIFRNSQIQWYVGTTLMTLDLNRSYQRCTRIGNLVMIHATFAPPTGVSVAGAFEIRNLPFKPAAHYTKHGTALNGIFGYGEWTNQGTNFDMIRVFCSDVTNWYFQSRLYNTFNALNSTANGTELDSL